MTLLSEHELHLQMADLDPSWALNAGRLERSYHFKNFVEAVAFVNRLIPIAEDLNHHPDLEVGYGRVKVSLMTHDAGGLTRLDFELAKDIDSMRAPHEIGQ